jgi:hypothetical protein
MAGAARSPLLAHACISHLRCLLHFLLLHLPLLLIQRLLALHRSRLHLHLPCLLLRRLLRLLCWRSQSCVLGHSSSLDSHTACPVEQLVAPLQPKRSAGPTAALLPTAAAAVAAAGVAAATAADASLLN